MGGYQAAAAFRRCAAEGVGFGGRVFYGGRQLAEGTSPALRATSPFQGEAKRGRRWPLGLRQPASPSEGDVASKLPPASLPPWGEGRVWGPPYFPPQGILIPSSRMLSLSVVRSGEGLVENLLGDVENARGEDIFAKSGGGKRKQWAEKACGG